MAIVLHYILASCVAGENFDAYLVFIPLMVSYVCVCVRVCVFLIFQKILVFLFIFRDLEFYQICLV